MRKLLIVALLLSAQAWAAIAYVGSAKQTTTPSGQTLTETITYTPVSGNTLYVWVEQTLAQTATITVADGEGTGNVYTSLVTCPVSNAVVKGCMFRASNISGTGAYTITATSSVNSFKSLMVLEFSGVALTSPGDGTNTQASSLTTPSAPITTTNVDDVLVSCYGSDTSSTVTITAGSGYTKVQEETAGATNFVGACQYRIVASTGTYNGNWTLSTGSDELVVQVADKAAAAAGGTVRRRVSVTVTQ